ncbi:hypothetical protein [Gimesia chilikensis]|uniref:hypothetical protein n=1 Tax=Gimesia chilikensis TaxID=2605989 RepID=UPI003A941F67
MTDEGKGGSPELAAELGDFVTEKKASVRDLQSTILHLTGLDRPEAEGAVPGVGSAVNRPGG